MYTFAPEFLEKLLQSRQLQKAPAGGAVAIPIRAAGRKFIDDLLSILFPHFAHGTATPPTVEALSNSLQHICVDLRRSLEQEAALEGSPQAEDLVADLVKRLPEVYAALLLDAEAIFEGDPAAKSIHEVIMTYPGFFAIATYRMAHPFYNLGLPVFARILTEYAHEKTGVDIHPGARIGASFCIDHGTGIVIGETAVIEPHVKIYQGVTLGALSVQKNMAKKKRHPTIGEHVVIYAHATILGGDTIIGHHSIIGGNVWLTQSVEPFSRVQHRADIEVKSAAGK